MGAISFEQTVAEVRAFNRFYTRHIGILNSSVFQSPFSLTEGRVLFELARGDELTATDLAKEFNLDPGYVSRLLKAFTKKGLILRKRSKSDGRSVTLALTAAGRAALNSLNQAANKEVETMLKPLSSAKVERLLGSMTTLRQVLDDSSNEQVPYLLRSLQPGDIGWIIHRQGLLYFQEYGWDETFEALVAEILGSFVKNYNPKHERCWIAERQSEVVGSVFLVRESAEIAKLRLLYVDASARGLGIGRRLVEECIQFAKTKGYKTLTLWTNDVLVSARRIYQAAGFQLVGEKQHHSFGKDLVGQNWSLDLTKHRPAAIIGRSPR